MPSNVPVPVDYETPSPISRISLRAVVSCVVVGLMAVLMLIWILIPQHRSRSGSSRVSCALNLKQIGYAILLYSHENRNFFPPDLATSLVTQDLVPEVFVCPSGHSRKATTQFASEPAARAANNMDYVYVGEGLTNDVSAKEPILFERLSDHDHDGGNVLFGDGHVQFIMKPQILKLLEPLRGTRLTDEEYNAIIAK